MATCVKCDAPIEPHRGPGRPRKACKDCSPRSRSKLALVEAKAPAKRAPARKATAPEAPATLVEAVRAELTAVGRLGSVEGQLAVTLAEAIESPQNTASGKASAARELRATMAAAMQGAQAADKVDDLASRRQRVSGQ